MKKLFLVCAVAFIGLGQASAQLETKDYGIFNRVGVGVGIGTTGITVDAATAITPYVGVRAGVDIFPSVKLNADLDLGVDGANATISEYSSYIGELNALLPAGQQIPTAIPQELDVQGKTKLGGGHVLFDIYPFPAASSFRVTVGAYFGSGKVADVYNREQGALLSVSRWNAAVDNPAAKPFVDQYGLKKIGAELGDYFISPDAQGNLNASIKVNGFRPYLGLGFGRAVPKNRVGCQFDLGCQFWGSPKVTVTDLGGERELKAENVGGDGGDVIKTISNVSVWPVLNFRVMVRIL